MQRILSCKNFLKMLLIGLPQIPCLDDIQTGIKHNVGQNLNISPMCECLTTCTLVLNDDSLLQAVFNFFLLARLKPDRKTSSLQVG